MTVGSGFRSTLANGTQLAAVVAGNAVVRLVYIWLITRFLGPADYGIWAYALASYMLLMHLSGFGLDLLLPLRIGGNKQGAEWAAGSALALRLVCLAALLPGLVLYALLLEPNPMIATALMLGGVALLGRGVAFWCQTVFAAHERAGSYTPLAVGMRALEMAVGGALLLSGAGILALFALHAASWIVEALIGLRLVRARLTLLRFSRDEALWLLRQGALLGFAAFLIHWLRNGPLLLYRHVDGNLEMLGQIAIAFQAAFIATALTQPFLAAAAPVVSRSHNRGDARLGQYGGAAALLTLALFAVGFGVLWIFGEPLVALLLGPEFRTAGMLLAPCVLIAGVLVAPQGYLQLAVLKGKPWLDAVACLLSGLLLLALVPSAIGLGGTDGAIAVLVATGTAWLLRLFVVTLAAIALRPAAE
ncbi:MAG: hypothetical protein AAGE18_14020 [Pseudomonadota bacterium]